MRSEVKMCKLIFLSVTSIRMKATRYFAPVGMKKVITFEYDWQEVNETLCCLLCSQIGFVAF